MKTLLICHQDSLIDRELIARWLGAETELCGIVEIAETRERKQRRIRREIQRVGPLRFLDVLAFRTYYQLALSRRDREWEQARVEEAQRRWPSLPTQLPILRTASPNSDEAREFITQCQPDIVLARCKFILKRSVYSIARSGTFVLHPGICPEYRNAHGCFWALVHDDRERIGATLLRIDDGVDTGPVYGYYTAEIDPSQESHIVIQHKVVLDNLSRIRTRLEEIHSGVASSHDTTGRPSNTWGQPWLTQYARWKLRARRRNREGASAAIS